MFKTTDEGKSWTAISPDLTRNDKSKQVSSGGPLTKDNTSVEYYDTVFTIAESPVQKDLLWAGTDDGLIHVSRDGGKNWTNVTPKGMPEWSLVSLIEASPHDAGTAYAAVDTHKLDDLKPYIYKTTDFGKTWAKITTRHSGRRLRARCARRSGAEESVVRGHGDGNLCFLRWRSELAIAATEFAEQSDPRPDREK